MNSKLRSWIKVLTGILMIGILVSSAQGTIIEVPTTQPTIQAGITAASNGDTVLVAPGSYSENLDYLGKNIVVASHYILDGDVSRVHETIIDGGTPAVSDTASTVLFHNGEGPDAVLCGFTITGGSGSKWIDPSCPAYTWRGGGGVFAFTSSPTIRDNLIIRNTAINEGDVDGAQGGGILSFQGNPLIHNNTIMRNEASYGAGIVLDYSGGRILNNLICCNTGGTVYGGGAFWTIGDDSNPIIIENNTIVGNVSHTAGGALYIWNSDIIARNNIIWDNSQAAGGPIQLVGTGTIDITYSDVEGGHTGQGNIDLPPQFADLNLCFLEPDSPCIDNGNPSPLYNDREDPENLGSALWPAMGTLLNDMGAYGGPGCKLLAPDPAAGIESDMETGAQGFLLDQPYPNPVSVQATIHFALLNPAEVHLFVCNVQGRVIRRLLKAEKRIGSYTMSWDGTDKEGNDVVSGTYFCMLIVGDGIETRRIVMVR